MGPDRAAGDAPMQRRHHGRCDAPLQHEVKTHQMDAHGFVRMPAARMLNGIAVDGQLMDLSEENWILELSGKDLLEQSPALGRGIVLAIIAPPAQRHFEPASRAGARLRRQRPSILRPCVSGLIVLSNTIHHPGFDSNRPDLTSSGEGDVAPGVGAENIDPVLFRDIRQRHPADLGARVKKRAVRPEENPPGADLADEKGIQKVIDKIDDRPILPVSSLSGFNLKRLERLLDGFLE